MGIGFVDEEGHVTRQLTEYYVERARSRPGMMMPGAFPVQQSGAVNPSVLRMIHIWDDGSLPGLESMVAAVHRHGVAFGAQLYHMGIKSGQRDMLGPSSIPALDSFDNYVPKEMTRDDIEDCVDAFGRAAERCIAVGFDFIEVHAAHGYLLSQFLTPYYNRRADEYGGSLENRTRFLFQVIEEVRRRIGDRVPVGVRINGGDFLKEGGWTLAELCAVAPVLESKSVNYLNVSTGVSYDHVVPPIYTEQGAFSSISQEVRSHVTIPVAVRGRIKSPVMADRLIAEGKADIVAMGRAQIADPEMVQKAREGKIADIRLCIADCRGCSEGVLRQGEISCAVNPRVGREYLLNDVPGQKKSSIRRVLVAGAGCAGLEAARRAAFAGHSVRLCESRGWIGGQLRLAARIPKRQEMADILAWYERQLNQLGVEIWLNTVVGENVLDEMRPDVLVVATGSLPEIPLGYITGLENVKDIELLFSDELLEDQALTEDDVLIVGGDQIGLQVADYLLEMGKKVYLVERGDHFADKMAFQDRGILMGRALEKGLERRKRANGVEIHPTDEVWLALKDGRERLPHIGTVVLSGRRRPNVLLAELAERRGLEVHVIGDASGVAGEDQGTVLAAICAGYEIGRQL